MITNIRKKFRKTDYSDVINSVVESFLPQGSKDALKVNMRFSAFYYIDDIDESIYDCDISTKVDLEILFYRPSAYTKVSYRVKDINTEYSIVEDHTTSWREGSKECINQAVEILNRKFLDKCLKIEYPLEDLKIEDLTFNTVMGSNDKAFEILKEPTINISENDLILV
jgi:hypothetical protein